MEQTNTELLQSINAKLAFLAEVERQKQEEKKQRELEQERLARINLAAQVLYVYAKLNNY